MLRKCEKCGRFFGDDNGGNICNACKLSTRHYKSTGDPERDKFTATRDLVYDNPDISPQGIIDIMADMGIDITIREIMKYVDEGRLSLNMEKNGNHCRGCGTRISFGKYCDRCRVKMEQQKIAGEAPKGKSDSDDKNRVKMHITDNKK